MELILEITTDDGTVTIREDELPFVTARHLAILGISRADLKRCFKEGAALMQGHTAAERVRPCAAQQPDGTWYVLLARYSPLSDPLMQGRPAGRG